MYNIYENGRFGINTFTSETENCALEEHALQQFNVCKSICFK